MKMENLHHINKLLVEQAIDNEISMTMSVIGKKVGIDDISSISRYIQKLEEIGQIKVIREPSKTNTYVIINQDPVDIQYMEKASDKQTATLRHYCYKFGVKLFRAIAKKYNCPFWIDSLTIEQASQLVGFFKQNENNISDDYDDWVKTIQNFPYNYEYTHYQDFIDADAEKTLIVPIDKLKDFVSTTPCSLVKKETLVFHATTYCYSHFDLIHLGYQHHNFQGKDYYFYKSTQ
jgi:hypothetical protein